MPEKSTSTSDVSTFSLIDARSSRTIVPHFSLLVTKCFRIRRESKRSEMRDVSGNGATTLYEAPSSIFSRPL